MNLESAKQLIAGLIAGSLAVFSSDLFAQDEYRMVFVKNNQICESGLAIPVVCLTSDASEKFLPVWSREGDKIAFLAKGSSPSVLSTLVVIDRRGNRLADIPLKVVGAGEVRSGMRQAESVEWVSRNRLVVSGTINPSSTEYLVVDVVASKQIIEFVGDAFGAAFSPDGNSYIAVTGSPHFTKNENRAPTLIVDGRQVAGLVPVGAELAGRPVWSPDGLVIAIPLRGTAGLASNGFDAVQIWHRASNTKQLVHTPVRLDALSWGASGLIAMTQSEATGGRKSGAAQAWELPLVTNPFQVFVWKQVSQVELLTALTTDRKLAAELRSSIQADAGANIDIWCNKCSFSKFPRRAPIDERALR
jgi:hypothetical protein